MVRSTRSKVLYQKLSSALYGLVQSDDLNLEGGGASAQSCKLTPAAIAA